ncbi:MAG: DsbA family protein [Mariprofundaceae bacterium]|nr:DsbA family protein [Mariprofundaceae bacterium]
MTVLYYIHDPMCSWCWAFRPVWDEVQRRLPEAVSVTYLLGGLAPDSDAPMPESVRREIQRHWKTIQQRVPGTRFNFDFWRVCIPRRSTYPACRAVIAARKQNSALEDAMIHAIQEAYYLQAHNPSDDGILIGLAEHLELDTEQFHKDLNTTEIQKQLMDEILLSQQLGAQGFPGLILKEEKSLRVIRIDYSDAEMILQQIHG